MSLNLFEKFLKSEQYIECLFGMEFERAWYAFLFGCGEFNEENAKMYIDIKDKYDEYIQDMINSIENKMSKPTCLFFADKCPYDNEGECNRVNKDNFYCIVHDN